MPVDDEALGRMLEALVAVGGASETLPAPPSIEPGEVMDVAQELLRRGWIDAAANLRGDGKLFAIREIRVTPAGQEALRHLRATVGRSAIAEGRSTPLEEKRRRRLLFIRKLYEVTDGSRFARANMLELGAELGWDPSEVQNVVEYLEGEGLLEYVTLGGGITITHLGVLEVEQTLSDPESPTEHFPAAVNVIHIEQMYGSQIQQGTIDSTLEARFLSQDDSESVHALLASLRADLADIVLEEDDRSELEAELGTAELQLQSSRPKLTTIRASLGRIGELLTKATVVSGSSVQLAAHINRLHEILPGI
jgi:hypothetical protein